MRDPDLWSRPGATEIDATGRGAGPAPRGLRALLLSEAGSVQTAVGLFGVALAVLVAFGVLHLIGSLRVNTLIFLILVVAVAAAGWDVMRERRKQRRGPAGDDRGGRGD
ncbi:hypothetical protein HKCCSP123_12335 [Rhodobacterales bacterium HKCCSP123]|nr:hypothetical protein [Rhodobacterales bacterium HKCCSP123]